MAPGDDEHQAIVGGAHDGQRVLGPSAPARDYDVGALGKLQFLGRAGLVELADLVTPSARGVDHDARLDIELFAGEDVTHVRPGQPVAVAQQVDDLQVVRAVRPVVYRGEGERQCQPGVVGRAVVEDPGGLELVAVQPFLELHGLVVHVHPVVLDVAEQRQDVVEEEAGLDHEYAVLVTPVDRERERLRVHQVWRVQQQLAPLAARLEYQFEVEHLQVADAAMYHLGRAAAGTERPVVLLDAGAGEATQGGVARCASAGDASAYDQHVVAL